MELSRFLRHYKVTHDAGNVPTPARVKQRVDDEFLSCLEQLGGKTFNHGIYRVYRGDQLEESSKAVEKVFEDVRKEVIVFASDWSGRQFGLDFTELISGKPSVACFDLGGPDSFCTDQSILDFHNRALVDQTDAALAQQFYKQWRKKHREDIAPDQCAGYKVPLFLGGKDIVANLELTDMEVYLELTAQLWHKVKDLPEGTPIGEILLED